jgi:hypothetical protein
MTDTAVRTGCGAVLRAVTHEDDAGKVDFQYDLLMASAGDTRMSVRAAR